MCNRRSGQYMLEIGRPANVAEDVSIGELNLNMRANLVQHSQYHGYWCPGFLRPQDISTHGIDYVELVSSWITWWWTSTNCVISMWKNDINCEYMFLYHPKNLAYKGLKPVSQLSKRELQIEEHYNNRMRWRTPSDDMKIVFIIIILKQWLCWSLPKH